MSVLHALTASDILKGGSAHPGDSASSTAPCCKCTQLFPFSSFHSLLPAPFIYGITTCCYCWKNPCVLQGRHTVTSLNCMWLCDHCCLRGSSFPRCLAVRGPLSYMNINLSILFEACNPLSLTSLSLTPFSLTPLSLTPTPTLPHPTLSLPPSPSLFLIPLSLTSVSLAPPSITPLSCTTLSLSRLHISILVEVWPSPSGT